MKKNILLWFTLLILVTGCGQVGQKSESADSWHTGTKGLEISFMTGVPPSVVYHGGGLYSGTLELWNKGVAEISSGNIFFSGYDDAIIIGIVTPAAIPADLDSTVKIEGKTQYNQEGGYDTLSNNAIGVDYNYRSGALNTKIRATAVYPYSTDFSTDVCVDIKPYAQEDKVCSMTDKTFSKGQGAPVAVTKIEPQAMVSQIRYKLTIKNSGNGKVIKGDKVTVSALSDLKQTDYDYVKIDNGKAKLGNTDGSCKPTEIKLINGEGFAFCTFSFADKPDAYTTRFELKLTYGYMSSTERAIEVRGPLNATS